jgi:hypothetical protein
MYTWFNSQMSGVPVTVRWTPLSTFARKSASRLTIQYACRVAVAVSPTQTQRAALYRR